MSKVFARARAEQTLRTRDAERAIAYLAELRNDYIAAERDEDAVGVSEVIATLATFADVAGYGVQFGLPNDRLLADGKCPADGTLLEYAGQYGAPGIGSAWKCPKCDADFSRVRGAFYRAELGFHIGTPEDFR